MSRIRVLVVDDAVVVRKLLTTVIDEDPDLEVVGIAANGAIALGKIEQLKPDIVTLDVEMPEMDGISTLRAIRQRDRSLPVIMFSTLTERGATATLEALALGASDYVTKPANVGSVTAAMDAVRRELIPKIKAFCRRNVPPPPPPPLRVKVVPAPATGRCELVAIGSSTGGPNALSTVLGQLPAGFDKPIVIAQHMPAVFTRYLAQRLDGCSRIRVREAEHGDLLEPGLALVAPGDHHMSLRRTSAGVSVVLDQSAPVNFCRPAVDVLFRSAADVYGGDVLAVVLTGMGHDGRDGCAVLKQRGATVIVQDQASSVVWGMPGAVHQSGLADAALPLDDVGAAITQRASSGARTRERI
ncbi:MAG: chemotaxis-specific protein-glutamate methyltransferase CheB [Actinobacteria bacterium]|uniref:protein-glutamate methylesterase n=1 Tax=freshwater metagenome TaxID=449393 RepID=A0A6J6EL57_9ZZZZ|nr:chemotaxis-specific protein-glutamate methyltransferase CheB [Actinomycetota bacterium]